MPSLKKILSVICAAAMAATTAAFPIAASAEATSYYDADFEGWTAGTLVNLGTPSNTSHESDGFVFNCGSRDSDQTTVGINVANDATHGNYINLFATKNNDSDARHPYINLAKSTGITVENSLYISMDVMLGNSASGLVLSDGTNKVTVNNEAIGGTGGTWYKVTYIGDTSGAYTLASRDADGKTVKTTNAAKGGLTGLSMIDTVGSSSLNANIDNLVVKDATAPVIALQDVSNIEAGVETVVAKVTGATGVTATSDNTKFKVVTKEPAADGSVSVAVTPDASASGEKATISITADGDVIAADSIEVTALSQEDMANNMAESIDFTGRITKTGDNEYTAIGDFTAPLGDSLVKIAWSSDSSAISVDEKGNATVNGVTSDTTVTLTATITYKEAVVKKEYKILVQANKVFYNESFDGASAPFTIASIGDSGVQSYNGITGNSVYRADGNTNLAAIIMADTEGSGNYLNIDATNWTVDKEKFNTRRLNILFTEMDGITVQNSLHMNFDFRQNRAAEATDLLPQPGIFISDGSADGAGIKINQNTITGSPLEIGKWYNVNVDIVAATATGAVTIKDKATGALVGRVNLVDTIKTVTRLQTDSANNLNVDIDNLVIADAIVPIITGADTTVLLGATETVATVANYDSITATVSDTANFSCAVSGNAVSVTSTSNTPSVGTVTITAKKGELEVSESYTVSSQTGENIAQAGIPSEETFGAKNDTKNDVIQMTSGGTIYADVELPTSETVEIDGVKYNVNVKWEITPEGGALAADGKLNVSDTNPHDVQIKKVVTYSKGGQTYTAEKAYNATVQFDPAAVKTAIEAAVEEANARLAEEDPGAAPYDVNEYLKTYLYAKQKDLDVAWIANNAGIPTSVSAERTITLPKTGPFGSEIAWASGSPSNIKISGDTATISQGRNTVTATLTATVNATGEREVKTFSINVYGTDTSSSSTGGGNGSGSSANSGSSRGSSGKPTGGVFTPGTAYPQNTTTNLNPNPSGFTDLDSVPWAVTAINNLYASGVITGKESTLFYPNDNITRAEFAKILVGAFQLSASGEASFSDTAGHWAQSYINTAFAAGVIAGNEDGTFAPDDNITRQDMAVMVLRAINAGGYAIAADTEAVTFSDDADIAAYAKDAIATLQTAGVVSGTGTGAFEPLASSTRAEACQMIYNVFH